MAYHDWLDNIAGYIPGARLEIAHLKIRQWRDANPKTQIEALRFIDIASLSPRDAFFTPLSWFVSTGLRRPAPYPNELSAFLTAGAGFSYQLGPFLTAVLFENDVLADNDIHKGHRYALGPKWVLMHQAKHAAWTLEATRHYDISGAEFDRDRVEMGVSVNLSKDWQWRTEAVYQRYTDPNYGSQDELGVSSAIMVYF